ICDASADMPGPTDTPALIREARTGRLLPGEGVLPLAELVAALPAGAPLAIEAPCGATADLPAPDRAKRAFPALSALTEARHEIRGPYRRDGRGARGDAHDVEV